MREGLLELNGKRAVIMSSDKLKETFGDENYAIRGNVFYLSQELLEGEQKKFLLRMTRDEIVEDLYREARLEEKSVYDVVAGRRL